MTGPVQPGRLDRVPSGIDGLDRVLAGGFVRGDIYLITGQPGTGKTTLANQIAHNHARAGGVAVYVTIMAEAHERMVAHLGGYDFFDLRQVGRGVYYVSVYDELRERGLKPILDLLRRLVRDHRATLLVLDGAGMFSRFAPTELEYRQFTFDLQGQLATFGCTTLLLAEHHSEEVQAIDTHVDGILVLESAAAVLRSARLLEVAKLRGVPHLSGRHLFAITPRGVEVYPRLEASVSARPPTEAARRVRHPLGITGLDDMLRGGLLSGTTTLLLGAPGAGKTTMGLHFMVEGARRGEPGLLATFHESPERLVTKAAAIGLDLGAHVAAGRVRVLWRRPSELLEDIWGRDLLGEAAALGARRLFVDAITDLQRLMIFPARLPAYLATLSNELRALDIATLFAAETRSVVGAQLDVPVSALVDNTLLLRYVELHSQLHRLISIVKLGESDYDTAIREFMITARGVEMASTFASAEAVLTGIARAVHGAGDARVTVAP